jgi:hypothetical protein
MRAPDPFHSMKACSTTTCATRACSTKALSLASAFAFVAASLGCAEQAVGVGGGTGTGGEGGAGGDASSTTTSTSSGGPIVEPDGPTRLTVVNGVVDAPSIQLCFVAWPDPASDVSPWPDVPLEFGRSAALALPDATIPSDSDVLVAVVSGDPGDVDCASLVDDPAAASPARVSVLGVFPQSTFLAPRSLLFAPIGCIVEGHTDEAAPSVCGPFYTPDEPALGATVAVLSRLTNQERVSFQAVHAASPSFSLDLAVRPSFDGAEPVVIATNLQPGSIAPAPAFAPIGTAELGSTAGATALGLVTGSPQTMIEQSMASVLAAGGLDGGALANGRGVALVAIGAAPGAPALGWHEGFRVLALPPNPLP